MLIGSIDIGIRNIGFCVYDSETSAVKVLEIIDLLHVPGCTKLFNFGDQSIVFLVKRVIEQRKELFASCAIVGVEKQMTRRMVLIQFAFECLLDEITTVVQISPRSVKKLFDTSRGNHAKNKIAAIACLYTLLDKKGMEEVAKFSKKDDIADAILQAMFIAHAYDALLDKKIKECSIPTKVKRKRKRRASTKKKKKTKNKTKKQKFFVE